jgi:sugar lactone lactonase YvrE/type II secretory pathway pseudopilin PulG
MACLRARARGSEDGFTIVESLLALVVVFLVMGGAVATLGAGSKAVHAARERNGAIRVAGDELERARAGVGATLGHSLASDPTLATDPAVQPSGGTWTYEGEDLVDAGAGALYPQHQWSRTEDGIAFTVRVYVTRPGPSVCSGCTRVSAVASWGGADDIYRGAFSTSVATSTLVRDPAVASTTTGAAVGPVRRDLVDTWVRFGDPSVALVDLAYDASGTAYVTDAGTHRVWRITPSGQATVLAGTGSAGLTADPGPAAAAQLSSPQGVAVAASGDVYVVDAANRRVRRIGPDHTIATVAGGGAAAPSAAGAPATTVILPTTIFDVAVDDATGAVYVSDTAGPVHVIDAGGTLRTLTNRTRAAGLLVVAGSPDQLVVAGAGRVEQGRASDFTSVTTLVGDGTTGEHGDNGPPTAVGFGGTTRFVARDAAGTLYVTSTSGAVRRVDATTKLTTTVAFPYARRPGPTGDGGPASQAGATAGGGVAVDPQGRLAIVDPANDRIRRVTPAGATVPVVWGGDTAGTWAGTGVAGGTGDGGNRTAATVDGPTGLFLGATGDLYIAERDGGRVRRITSSGAVSTVASGLAAPTAVAVDAAGAVWVTERTNGALTRIDPDGTRTVVATGLAQPEGLVLDAAGRAYVAEAGAGRITAVAPDGTTTVLLAPGVATAPWGLAFDADGALLVADRVAGRVLRVGTAASTLQSGTAVVVAVGFDEPTGVALDGAGHVLVTEQGSRHAVRRIVEPAGRLVSGAVAGGHGAGSGGNGGYADLAVLSGPAGIVVRPNGTLLVAETSGQRIRTVSVAP